MRYFSWPRCCAIITTALGIELIVGWLLHVESMVRILPTSNAAVFNTAIAFVLCGTALMVGQKDWQIRWRRFVAVIVIIGASLIFLDDVFGLGLGLEWEALHRAVQDGNARIGRLAPTTCLALLLLSVIFFCHDLPRTNARRVLVGACCTVQVLLIGTGVIGLMLDPTLMFGWYKFNRMAAPTAFGLSMLTLGVYLAYRAQSSAMPVSIRQQERSILVNGTLILMGMGMACALTTFVIFANYQQEAIRDRLQAELTAQTRLAEFTINQSALDSGSLVSRPLLLGLIRRVAVDQEPAARAQLTSTLTALLKQEFSSMSLQWADARPGILVGKPLEAAALAIPMREPIGGTMLWGSTGFVYRNTVDIRTESGQVIALITTERQLKSFSNIYTPLIGAGRSAEVVICGLVSTSVVCFPSRLHPSPLLLGSPSSRNRLPVDDALDGKSEVRTGIDYRNVNVVAAYSHIGNTGFAVVSKVDAVELYQPINFLLSRSIVVLTISLVIGFLLLRRMVVPLVRSIVESESHSSDSEARAVLSERRLTAITDNVPALIAFIDAEGRYRFANATYERWFGKPVADILGKKPQQLLDAKSMETVWPRMHKALAGEVVEFTFKTDSRVLEFPQYLAVTYIPDRDEHGTVLGFNVLAFDATEQHEHQQALTHLAYHDSLTELPNRRLFYDRLGQALARGRRHQEVTTLMYLDIDHFKQINDTLGHDRGDMLLRDFAKRLCLAVRASDTVARLGGDEFTIIMESVLSQTDVGAIAQKILEAIRMPFDLDGNITQVTTSIGISFSNGAEISVEGFLQQSDEALYAAKSAGRNRYAVYREPLTMVAESLKR